MGLIRRPETAQAGRSLIVVYDLQDPLQWTAAGEARRAWGREHTEIHVLTNDHIIIEYKAGGAALVEGGRKHE